MRIKKNWNYIQVKRKLDVWKQCSLVSFIRIVGKQPNDLCDLLTKSKYLGKIFITIEKSLKTAKLLRDVWAKLSKCWKWVRKLNWNICQTLLNASVPMETGNKRKHLLENVKYWCETKSRHRRTIFFFFVIRVSSIYLWSAFQLFPFGIVNEKQYFSTKQKRN